MDKVLLVLHLMIAAALVGVVLLQRSEGGGLGMGGGGGVMSGRQAATALSKLTWIFAAGFLVTSISLTIIAAKNAAGNSVVDGISTTEPAATESAPAPVTGDDLLNPTAPPATEEPAVPPKAD